MKKFAIILVSIFFAATLPACSSGISGQARYEPPKADEKLQREIESLYRSIKKRTGGQS